jgi:hypothetical protein
MAGVRLAQQRNVWQTIMGYRFQHLPNADLKSPNDGINFQQIRLAYLFLSAERFARPGRWMPL